MNKIIILLTLILITEHSRAQVKAPLAIEEFKQGLNPVDEILLFDLMEIKNRKIDTAYIIYHPASWAEDHPIGKRCNCSYNDTLLLYRFDSEGRIIQYTTFQQLGDYSTTFHYDTSGNIASRSMFRRIGAKQGTTTFPYTSSDSTSFKTVTKRNKDGNDSLITQITLLKFNHGLDTATIETKRYNPLGRLIEIQSNVNKKNALELGDDTGESSYHFKYDYDNRGRLIYYRDFESNEYEKITYPFYGKLTEVYNANTNDLKKQELKLVNEQNGIITVTFDSKQIILTPLEKGSKLFKLRTIVEPGDIPLMMYHEIIYK